MVFEDYYPPPISLWERFKRFFFVTKMEKEEIKRANQARQIKLEAETFRGMYVRD